MPGSGGHLGTPSGPRECESAWGHPDTFRLLRFSHIFASVMRETLEEHILRGIFACPLTSAQFHLLKLMCLNGQHPLGEVAGFLGVTPPAATKNIDKLERLGLVARCPSEGDRRATLLSVSRKGRNLVRKYENAMALRLEPALRQFDSDDLNRFVNLLERFCLALIDRSDCEDGMCLRCAAYCEENCPIGRMHSSCPYEKVRTGHRN